MARSRPTRLVSTLGRFCSADDGICPPSEYIECVTQRKLFIAFTNAVEGRADEFNDWYNDTHLHEVLSIAGFRSVQRFKASPAQRERDQPPFEYLAIYEVEGDAPELVDAMTQWATSGQSSGLSPAIAAGFVGCIYEPITEVLYKQ
jgi:hypothetical protein